MNTLFLLELLLEWNLFPVMTKPSHTIMPQNFSFLNDLTCHMNLWSSEIKGCLFSLSTRYLTLYILYPYLFTASVLRSLSSRQALLLYVQMCRVGCSSWNNFVGDNHLAGIWPRGKELLPESELIRKINRSLRAGSSGFYSRQDAFFFLLLITRARLCWQECNSKSAQQPARESFLREGYGFNSCLFVRQWDYTE